MKKWTAVDSAVMPDGKTISLGSHDGSYSVRINGVELMSTRRHASEDRLAELACEHVTNKRGACVLIGGLGFGFTLKAALAALSSDATVVMAEILAEVIAWNRNEAFGLAGQVLEDPRVMVVQQDVSEVIYSSTCRFDSIILDVDNGPAALSTESNGGLYNSKGLKRVLEALRPGGCLAVWSATADPAFEKRMAKAGFHVDVQRCRAHGNSGGWHTIFLGMAKLA